LSFGAHQRRLTFEFVKKEIQGTRENSLLVFGSKIVKLTSNEFSLLALLAEKEGRVLSHQHILKKIWRMGYIEQTQYLREFVAQLRKKSRMNRQNPNCWSPN